LYAEAISEGLSPPGAAAAAAAGSAPSTPKLVVNTITPNIQGSNDLTIIHLDKHSVSTTVTAWYGGHSKVHA